MSQKDYNIKIIEALLKRGNHIRGLARALGTNQTTISRKIQDLYKENVVDYRQEGKNKVFFLRKTLEAQHYVFIVELFRAIGAIKKYPRLYRIAEKIRENKKITMALLFGSYAKGIPKKESDIDLYIDTDDRKTKEEAELIDTKLSVKIGRYDRQSLLIREIEKNHIVLKGVEEFYGKNQFFG